MKKILALLVFLTSCLNRQVYVPPVFIAPEEWKEPHIESGCPLRDAWWEMFNDPVLNDLEEQALEANQQLLTAFYRVLETRDLAQSAAGRLWPKVVLNPSYSNSIQLAEIGPVPQFLTTPIFYREHLQQYNVPLTLQYEVDLWHKLWYNEEAALSTAEASTEAWKAVYLSLTASVASQYFQIRTLDGEYDYLSKTLISRKGSLDILTERFDAGLINEEDVARAQVEWANAKAEIANTLRQRENFVNTLAVLLGVPASTFCLELNPLAGTPPAVPAGLPSTMLKSRPDIAEAERRVSARFADIGFFRADLFPSISLTAALGFASPDFGKLFEWISRLWSLGANVSQTVFDAGINVSNLEAAKARHGQAVAEYYQKVLVAFQEVESALNSKRLRREQLEALDASVASGNRLMFLSSDRYEHGLTTYLDVVDAERSLLETQRVAIQVRGLEFEATIDLIKALGGSFSRN